MSSELQRHQFVLARFMLRQALCQHAPAMPMAAWRFTANRHGKPVLASPSGAQSIKFNLSHTPGLVALAVVHGAGGVEPGIDVEPITKPVFNSAFAEHYFDSREVAVLNKLAPRQQARRVAELWTLKEAFAKARGQPLWPSLTGDVFSYPDQHLLRLESCVDGSDEISRWQAYLFDVAPNYILTLALKSQVVASDLKLVTKEFFPGEGLFEVNLPIARRLRPTCISHLY
nr:4'-phosphopantetheinyl transferase superfamily protein [Agaribacterium haliotis]